MNSEETLLGLLLQLSTIIGIYAAIWWPRKLTSGTATAHAFRALRTASVCLSLSFLLVTLTLRLPFEGSLPQRLILAATLGTVPLMPLSSAALALDRGRRLRALLSVYGALIFAAVQAWFCIIRAIVFLIVPPIEEWHSLCIIGAIALCTISVVSIMEIYASIRQPIRKG